MLNATPFEVNEIKPKRNKVRNLSVGKCKFYQYRER